MFVLNVNNYSYTFFITNISLAHKNVRRLKNTLTKYQRQSNKLENL